MEQQKRIPTVDLISTGRNITLLRKRAGYSVRELQQLLGFESPQAIYKWQWGDNLPSVDNLLVLGDAFGVTLDELIVRTA